MSLFESNNVVPLDKTMLFLWIKRCCSFGSKDIVSLLLCRNFINANEEEKRQNVYTCIQT